MPEIRVNGAEIHYEERGSGPATIVFSHGLLFDTRMWDKQVAALEKRYRCIVYDHRGQGRTEVTESGYDMDTLARDAVELIQALDCAPCHFVGLSMGGFVGLRLGIRYGSLLRSLSLLDTSPHAELPEKLGRYRLLNFIARWFGLGLVAGQVMSMMFGPKFLSDDSRAEERALWRKRLTANDRIGITRAVRGVIERADVTEEIHRIDVPTLIVVGDHDVTTIPMNAEQMHAAIAGSRLVVIPDSGHMSAIEEPDAVNAALREFLDGLT